MTPSSESLYEFVVKDIDEEEYSLEKWKGKVLLIVNTASQCGFTPQYKDLGKLYNRYKDSGLVILGFPCNQFGNQEPGSNDEIKQFAKRWGASFPMHAKVDVNGPEAEPLYTYLKEKQKGMIFSDLKWNFSKFLVDRQGNVIKRYGSVVAPMSIEDDIKQLL